MKRNDIASLLYHYRNRHPWICPVVCDVMLTDSINLDPFLITTHIDIVLRMRV
jgi:hypothetical protein